MIEEALRKRLQPIVNRRRYVYLACRLSVYWLVSGLVGIGLVTVEWLFGFSSQAASGVLCIATVVASILAVYSSRRILPDYRAIARNIEQRHPDLQELLLAAIEQKPQSLDGRLGYLQEQVVQDALAHATGHDWTQSISTKKFVLSHLALITALVFLIAVLLQITPSASSSHKTAGGVLTAKGYHITVTPGDTTVELGTPLVILARFEGRVPSDVSLLFGPADGEPQNITLAKNLADPVFGGVIQQVNSDMLYHIEYAGRRTQDYKISTYEYPSLIRADARIVYPAYTKLPEKVVVDARRISVVEGSQVTMTFTLNKPVTTAQLISKDGPPLDLAVDGEHPKIYSASLPAAQSQRYELHLVDPQGRTSPPLAGPPRFVIDVYKNMPPDLKPTFPNRDLQVSPLEELTLEAEVSDDFGVTGYGLSYTLVGAPAGEVTLTGPAVQNQKQQIQYLLAMEQLDVQPDQLLTYYFWAEDIGPDGNTRRVSSDMYFAEVRSFEEVFRESQSFQDQRSRSRTDVQGGDQADRQGSEQLARLQKQIISATWNIKQQIEQSSRADEYKDDLDVVRRSQADVLDRARSALSQAENPAAMSFDPTQDGKALQTAAKHMETSLEHLTQATTQSSPSAELTSALGAEQSAYQELLKLRQREFQVARGRNTDRSNNNSARFEQQLQQLELSQRENRYETERLAQSRQQDAQREDLQVLNRLRDLARRQSEMTDRLREAQAALQQARNDQQRQEILRELQRLRDEQLETLRDVDELQQRMESPENRQRMADTREQLTDSRSRIRQSADELEKGMVSNAVTSTTRAQRQLEQMREEFQRSTSNQFADQMRNMRDQAQQLDQHQREIADRIRQELDSRQKSLTDSGVNRELADRIDQQKKDAGELIDQMKDVSEQSETSEPLLSRKLYDTLRRASTGNVDKALEITGALLRRNFLPQAQEVEQRAGQGIEDIRKAVEDAANSVLGDEAESLRLAQRQIDELLRQVNDQMARTGGTNQQRLGDVNEPVGIEPNQTRLADARSGLNGQQPNRQGESQPAGRASEDRNARTDSTRTSDRQNGSQRNGTRSARTDPAGGGDAQGASDDSAQTRGPLTGGDFRQWSDGLRDVEEMLTESGLRGAVAQVRDRARAIQADFVRHGKKPQWDMVRQQITNPLTELRRQLSDKLAQLESSHAMVPIDRDPVPGRFTEAVRKYFENLGDEN